jgi:EmrB/QacA subfamily drug resistance transporter
VIALSPPVRSADPASDPAQHRRETAVLLLTTLGTVMVAVDSTIVILALPTMSRQLASPLGTIIWAILVYLLLTAALTTQAGRIGDLLGRGRVYNAGFAVFTLGSALCGFAPTAEFLIGARAVQAIGGAIMFANAGALIASVFPPARRGQAFGYLVFGWSVGAILGILLGGVITTTLGWRYNFFINLPIGGLAVALGLRTLPRGQRLPAELDIPGFVSFSVALGLICYGTIELAVFGPSLFDLVLVAVGLAIVPVFVLLELRAPQPMLDLRELRQRLLGFSLMASFLQALGNLSVIFLLTLYLQGIRALTPLDASLLLVPGYLVGAFAGPFSGRYVDRIGPRGLATAGLVLLTVAVLAYSLLSTSSWLGFVPMISGVSGVGTGMFFPANNTAIMSQASPRTFGAISGLRATLANMGALLSFVVALSIASASVSSQVAAEVFLGTNSLGAAGGAFLGGIHAALLGSASILVVAAVLSYSRGRTAPSTAPAAAPGGPPPSLRTELPPRVADDPVVIEGERAGLPHR